MGKTRDFLDHLEILIERHRIEEAHLIKEATFNPHQKKAYQHQATALVQKYEQNIKELIKHHITYLGEKDPYGRKPLWGAEGKKALFTELFGVLAPLEGKAFMSKLAKEINALQSNPIIDQPRWPSLQMNHVFNFFKSMFMYPSAENRDDPKQTKKK